VSCYIYRLVFCLKEGGGLRREPLLYIVLAIFFLGYFPANISFVCFYFYFYVVDIS
jgi:hypothetical protein